MVGVGMEVALDESGKRRNSANKGGPTLCTAPIQGQPPFMVTALAPRPRGA